MKKFLLIISVFILLCGCVNKSDYIERDDDILYNTTKETVSDFELKIKGLWLPVYEAAPRVKDKGEYEKFAEEMMKNISDFGFTDVFFQVRANCDSVYSSEIFLPNYLYADNGELCFDALTIILKYAHKYSLSLHAWINPYRVCSDNTKSHKKPNGISKEEIFSSGRSEYLNPCSEKVKRIILSGVKEILENYDVDGIHIDDYFYPSQSNRIDDKEYNTYKSQGGNLNLSDFRRENISSLISSIYSLIKSYNKDVVFSISPGADIVKDRDLLFADVERWCNEYGYCDMIMPQIYFGFENESLPFCKTFDKWREICSNQQIKLCPGLAIYKSGQRDKYAGSGKEEWILSDDVIKRQIEYLSANGADGYSLFSYNYIFGNTNLTKEEVKNLKSVI